MAKSKVLLRTASRVNGVRDDAAAADAAATASDTPARPRTAHGERGILRRLRIGRMFFGLGSTSATVPEMPGSAGAASGPSAAAAAAATHHEFATSPVGGAAATKPADGAQALHRLFRASSAQLHAHTGDLGLSGGAVQMQRLADAPVSHVRAEGVDNGDACEPSQTLIATHQQQQQPLPRPRVVTHNPAHAEVRKSHYSVLSRRSSAPDVAEFSRRHSRYAVTDDAVHDGDASSQLSHMNASLDCLYEEDKTSPLQPVAETIGSFVAKAPASCEPDYSGDAHHHNSSGSSATFVAPVRKSPIVTYSEAPALHDDTRQSPFQADAAAGFDAGVEAGAETDAGASSASSVLSYLSKGHTNSSAYVSLPGTVPASTGQSVCDLGRQQDACNSGTAAHTIHSLSRQHQHQYQHQHQQQQNLNQQPPVPELTIVTSLPQLPAAPPPAMTVGVDDALVPLSFHSNAHLSIASNSTSSPPQHVPEITLVWRQQHQQQQRQSMPESPISPNPTFLQSQSSPYGHGLSRRVSSFIPPKGASDTGSDTGSDVHPNPTLILMGSVKQRGDKKNTQLDTSPSPGKSLLVPSTKDVLAQQSTDSFEHPNNAATGAVAISGDDGNKNDDSEDDDDDGDDDMRPLQLSLSPPMILMPAEDISTAPVNVEELPLHAHTSVETEVIAPPARLEEPLVSAGTSNVEAPPAMLPSTSWIRKASMHRRPKSLYERPSCKPTASSEAGNEELIPSRAAASIASAKAFLTMIASGSSTLRAGSNPGNLTIITSERHNSLRQHSFGDQSPSSYPSSAPAGELATAFGFNSRLEGGRSSSGSSAALVSQDGDRYAQRQKSTDSSDKSDAPAASPGSRSLRVRSKLAGVGIRRASTYVWNRSSVFMKSLSSADDLPDSQQQSQGDRVLEADADSRSTRTQGSAESQTSDLSPSDMAAQRMSHPAEVTQPRVSAVPVSLKKSPAAMRLHATRELVMTEKNFVDNLFVIKKVWMEPVFSSANSPKPIIPYQTARVIFFGIAALHMHASQFYREMDFVLGTFERNQTFTEATASADDGMRIGSLFRTNDRHWSDFIAYVRNYGTAVNCLKQLQDYKPYQRYHEECMSQKRTNRQSLKDLLMLPIQRITRYTLLLKNILKHTPAVHSDHIDLCRAVKNVTHFASIVNECRRKQEDMYRLIEVFGTIERCPPLPLSESRTYISEFFVRELISRQPTRLLLFSDMLIVTQAPPQTKVDADGHVESVVEWTYYGIALLDHVEVQNADESTNTLVTILSLNRNIGALNNAGSTVAGAGAPALADGSGAGSSRRSLPSGNDPLSLTHTGSGSRTYATASSQNSISDTSESSELRKRASAGSQGHGQGLASKGDVSAQSSSALPDLLSSNLDSGTGGSGSSHKKRSRGRKGLLRVSSRDSIPEHIAALSHSTFPSPVPSPMQLNRSSSRLNHMSSSGIPDGGFEGSYAAHSQIQSLQMQQQRPKTASGGHPSYSSKAPSAHSHSSALYASTVTLTNTGMSIFTNEAAPTLRVQPSCDILAGSASNLASAVAGGGVGGVPGVFGHADAPRAVPVQLTLVMQHASSGLRKQFVRALKDATAKFVCSGAGGIDDGAVQEMPLSDSSTDVLNLHPL
ncbi:hypothetical protein GGI07_005474 [Coemansia sp. Benny D115]|nr:hypothetical protein GGI07_005474 [Coemansia sp. Benny D115]